MTGDEIRSGAAVCGLSEIVGSRYILVCICVTVKGRTEQVSGQVHWVVRRTSGKKWRTEVEDERKVSEGC